MILYYEGTVNDIETQRKGLVYIVWLGTNDGEGLIRTARKAREQQRERSSWQITDFATARTSAIHICSPNTPFFSFISSLWTFIFPSQWRSRLQIHSGIYKSCNYRVFFNLLMNMI